MLYSFDTSRSESGLSEPLLRLQAATAVAIVSWIHCGIVEQDDVESLIGHWRSYGYGTENVKKKSSYASRGEPKQFCGGKKI
ncbi:hypothetical protein PF003_g32972 [Phytophthora fragariae]|nr:hypothetical protein PF003_g32972 [Phytophthora fragariae]